MNVQSMLGEELPTIDEEYRELEVFSDGSYENDTLEITSKQHFVNNLSNDDAIQDIFNKRSKNNTTTPLVKAFNKKVEKLLKSGKSSLLEVCIVKPEIQKQEDKCANSIIHDEKDILLVLAPLVELAPLSNTEFNQISVSASRIIVEKNSKKRKSSNQSDFECFLENNGPLKNSRNSCRLSKSKNMNRKTKNQVTTEISDSIHRKSLKKSNVGINNKAKNFQKIFGQAVVRFILHNKFTKKSQMYQIYQTSGLKDEKSIMLFKDWVVSITRSYISLEMFRKVWLGNFQNFVDRKFAEILTKFTKLFMFEECLQYFNGGKFKDPKVLEKYLECIEIFKSGFERPENFTTLLRYC